MSAEMLFAEFERVCDAPDAVASLRQFILELAVRGKLIERDPNDESVSALLKWIEGEKERRVKEGELKQQQVLPSVKPNEAWFEIPAGWRWVRLGTITQVVMGQSPPGNTYNKTGEGMPLINGPVEFTEGPFGKTIVNQYTTAPTNLCEEGDLLLCVRGSTTGRTNIAGFRACIGRGVAAIRPFFDDRYVRLFIWRVRASIIAMGRGIAFPSVSRQQIEELPVPLPPLAEQNRIVSKVEELMQLCDRLEVVQAERDSRRDRLATAALYHLSNGKHAETVRGHVDFYLSHVSRLTRSKEQIKELRKTILNLAVRGKMVPQDHKDQPALELVKRFQAEKERLIEAGKVKKEKLVPDVNEEEQAFAVPSGWTWVRLDSLTQLITKGSSPKWQGVQYVPKEEGILFVTSENVGNYRLRKLDELKYVERKFNEIEPRSILKTGDILMNLVGASIGRTAVYDLDDGANINQAVALIRLVQKNSDLLIKYLVHYFNSPLAVQLMLASRVTTAQPNMSLTDVRGFPLLFHPSLSNIGSLQWSKS